jgi:integrase/recombinase XerD
MPKITTLSAVRGFLLNCEAEGLADSTLRWYRSILNVFQTSSHISPRVDQVTAQEIRLFLVGLRDKEYSPDTIADYTRALHRFWKWAVREYDLRNPMGNIRYPAQPKAKEPKTVHLDDVIAMFQAAESGLAIARDRAILAFALDTGARAGGICTARMADLDMERRSILVTEKGKKTRAVVFTKVTAALLSDWIAVRQNAPALFYNLDTLEPLTPSGLLQLFRRLGKRAGVKGRVNPHSFRHTFGKEYVKAGGDVFTLARIMGHTDVNTTAQHYAVFTSEEVAASHEKYSPIHQLIKGEEEK